MRVLMDVDGVVCDFIGGYLSLIKKATGKEFKYDDVTDWSFEKCLGLTTEEIKATDELLFQPKFVLNLQSLNGAYRGVSKILARGHEIVFVTSPWKGHPTWSHEREQWIEDRWPGAHVIHTHHKYYVEGDVLIDDKPSHIENYVKHHGLDGVLFDAPYNRNFSDWDFPYRACNWDEVLEHLETINGR